MGEAIRVDKRIIKTKNNLKSALVELLKTHKIEDISIVELTNLANVNRKTFYLHYNEVSSVFKEIENTTYELVKKYVYNIQSSIDNVETYLYDLFKIFIDDVNVLTIIRETQYAKTFTVMLEKLLIESTNKNYEQLTNNSTPHILQYTIAYHVFGSVRLFYTWIRNCQNLDLKVFSKFLANIIIKGSKGNFESLQ